MELPQAAKTIPRLSGTGTVRRHRPLPIPLTGPEGQFHMKALSPPRADRNGDVQLNVWTMGFIISPFLSPFAFGFLAARVKSVRFHVSTPLADCV